MAQKLMSDGAISARRKLSSYEDSYSSLFPEILPNLGPRIHFYSLVRYSAAFGFPVCSSYLPKSDDYARENIYTYGNDG